MLLAIDHISILLIERIMAPAHAYIRIRSKNMLTPDLVTRRLENSESLALNEVCDTQVKTSLLVVLLAI